MGGRGSSRPSTCLGAPFEVATVVFVGPHRHRAADDRAGGNGTEVAAVEAVADGPVHEKDLAVRDAPAALPDGQITAEAVAQQRLAHRDAIDGNARAGSADLLPRKAGNALHERDTAR